MGTHTDEALWRSELENEVAEHEATKKELRALKEEIAAISADRDRFLGGFKLPTRMVSVVDLSEDGKEMVVGWDTCGVCIHHVSICQCPTGPSEPKYITKFRTEGRIPAQLGVTRTPVLGRDPVIEPSTGPISDTGVPVPGVPSATTCSGCGKSVNLDPTMGDADLMDDGRALCFTCQEAS
jgi:hypothetical protein